MEGVRLRLADARERIIAKLGEVGITPWLTPQAGMFLWCRLPAGVDAAQLARDCLKDGMVLAPGNAFSQSPEAGRFMRFNAAQSLDPRIHAALKRALAT